MIGRLSKLIEWAKEKLARLGKTLWRPLASASSPFFFSGAPDILGEAPDGTIDVGRPGGVAPLRPGYISHSDFSTERTKRLARKAAAFLFDLHDFATVPAQFWPFLERSFDPGQALTAFLRALGVDPELVRRHDPAEVGKARDVIDLLVRSGTVLHRLKPEVRQAVTRKLGSGDFAAVRDLAELASHLQSALDFASRWSGKAVFASFRELLTTLERMLDDPMRHTASDAAEAVSIVARFDAAQCLYDQTVARFEPLTKALGEAWPSDWRGGSQEEAFRESANRFEAVAETMRASASLTLDELNEGNAYLAGRIRELDELLEAAIGAKKKESSGRSGKSRKTPPPPDELEIALTYFGFSKVRPPATKNELRSAWKIKIKALHPDSNIDATPEALARNKAEWNLCERYNSALLRHFSWN